MMSLSERSNCTVTPGNNASWPTDHERPSPNVKAVSGEAVGEAAEGEEAEGGEAVDKDEKCRARVVILSEATDLSGDTQHDFR